METRLLDGMVIYAKVVAAGSFTLVAQQTGHSTSYISKEINKLEARLGVRLLNRTTRSISMTPEGEMYYVQCQNIIADAFSVEQQLAGHQLEPQGHLRVGCPVSFGLSRIRPILAEFMARFPKVTIELELDDRTVDMVADGFDVVIRASGQLEDSSLVSRKILESSGVTVASPEYLSQYGTPKKPQELIDHKIIAYSRIKNKSQWVFKRNDGQEEVVSLASHILTNSGEMNLALSLAGQGITRIPLFYINDEIKDGKLVSLFTDYASQSVGVYLVYPSRKHMSSKVRSFIDYISNEFS